MHNDHETYQSLHIHDLDPFLKSKQMKNVTFSSSECESFDCSLWFSSAEEASERDEPDAAVQGSGLPVHIKHLLGSLKHDATRIITFSDDDLQVRTYPSPHPFFWSCIKVQICVTAVCLHFLKVVCLNSSLCGLIINGLLFMVMSHCQWSLFNVKITGSSKSKLKRHLFWNSLKNYDAVRLKYFRYTW